MAGCCVEFAGLMGAVAGLLATVDGPTSFIKEEGKNIRGWKPQAAGERYAEYIRDAFKTPYVIGAFWCNPINSKPGFSKAGIKQGLFDEGLTPRPTLNRAIVELNKHLTRNTPVREN